MCATYCCDDQLVYGICLDHFVNRLSYSIFMFHILSHSINENHQPYRIRILLLLIFFHKIRYTLKQKLFVSPLILLKLKFMQVTLPRICNVSCQIYRMISYSFNQNLRIAVIIGFLILFSTKCSFTMLVNNKDPLFFAYYPAISIHMC